MNLSSLNLSSMRRFLARSIHRRRSISFYRRFIGKEDLCFDIGANLGERAEIFLALGARVVCVEPQQYCVERLKEQYGSNPKVTIVPEAVGPKDGIGELSVCEGSHVISTMSRRWIEEGRFSGIHKWERRQRVVVTTLDALIAAHGMPRFCKIDIEGYELQALQGLSKPMPCISFEFTREFLDDARACIDALNGIGRFRYNVSLGESMALMSPEWLHPEELLSTLEPCMDDLAWGDIYAKHEPQ